MTSKNFTEDFKQAIEIVWVIISIIIFGTMLMILLFPEIFLNMSPICFSKSNFGTECFMCGMTSAFVEISKGSFNDAFTMNNFSVNLFIIFLLNSFFFICYLSFRLRKSLDLKRSLSYFLN